MEDSDPITEMTKGRPFVLVLMAYKDGRTGRDKRVWVYDAIRDIVEHEFNLACIRADEVCLSGHELLDKIHRLIDRAALVIAEISDPRPNVFYELGYAMGSKKEPPLLLIESGSRAPYDLQGREVFEYRSSRSQEGAFRRRLIDHLRGRLKPLPFGLRRLLCAPKPTPAYIVASPKYPGKRSRIRGQLFDTKTFGDQIGILGLVSALGWIYGNSTGIELISAQYAPPDLLDRDINLYLIGSVKVNPWTGRIMDGLEFGKGPRWSFCHAKGKKEKGDWPVKLFREENGICTSISGKLQAIAAGSKEVWTEDWGVLIRTPHPTHPDRRIALIMAGAHSLGTAAACLVGTRPALTEQLRRALPAGSLEDHATPIWALVRGTLRRPDFLIDEEGVTIEEAGVYK